MIDKLNRSRSGSPVRSTQQAQSASQPTNVAAPPPAPPAPPPAPPPPSSFSAASSQAGKVNLRPSASPGAPQLGSASASSLFGAKKPQAATASSSTASTSTTQQSPIKLGGKDVPGTTQPIAATGNSGMDKTYFHNSGEKFGWLATSPQVVDQEMTAYKKLATLQGIHLPQTLEVPSGEKGPTTTSLDGKAVPETGYFIEHLNISTQFKPKMLALSAETRPGRGAVATYNQLSPAAQKQMHADIQAIKHHISDIAGTVGELTLTLDPASGHVRLLDVGPVNGQAGGADLAEKAVKGLDNLLAKCPPPA